MAHQCASRNTCRRGGRGEAAAEAKRAALGCSKLGVLDAAGAANTRSAGWLPTHSPAAYGRMVFSYKGTFYRLESRGSASWQAVAHSTVYYWASLPGLAPSAEAAPALGAGAAVHRSSYMPSKQQVVFLLTARKCGACGAHSAGRGDPKPTLAGLAGPAPGAPVCHSALPGHPLPGEHIAGTASRNSTRTCKHLRRQDWPLSVRLRGVCVCVHRTRAQGRAPGRHGLLLALWHLRQVSWGLVLSDLCMQARCSVGDRGGRLITRAHEMTARRLLGGRPTGELPPL